MLQLVITCNGNTETDLDEALNEARKRFREGNTSGFDRNTRSSFNFEVTGEKEPVGDQE
ncbi:MULTISPECIES: hypothetical protein [Stenotrophomonas]|uniref:hypothetical protein n=1 Tax=Stenotrophomonas TaxID=40323 RepID=UPI0021CA5929|nr:MULTISPECIES: hypothetical protein [Stenotrophomonas]MCU1136962.1 hypothetical protein [Stenotrophomonas maltophilia]MEC4339713.1 hypothetical protein [Stenotrophomonas pavanii]